MMSGKAGTTLTTMVGAMGSRFASAAKSLQAMAPGEETFRVALKGVTKEYIKNTTKSLGKNVGTKAIGNPMSEKQQQPESPEDENRLIAQRREKLNVIREKRNAFPNDFRPENSAAELPQQFAEKTKEELQELALEVSVAGRMMLDRKSFKVLQDGSGRIQIFANK